MSLVQEGVNLVRLGAGDPSGTLALANSLLKGTAPSGAPSQADVIRGLEDLRANQDKLGKQEARDAPRLLDQLREQQRQAEAQSQERKRQHQESLEQSAQLARDQAERDAERTRKTVEAVQQAGAETVSTVRKEGAQNRAVLEAQADRIFAVLDEVSLRLKSWQTELARKDADQAFNSSIRAGSELCGDVSTSALAEDGTYLPAVRLGLDQMMVADRAEEAGASGAATVLDDLSEQ